MGNKDYENAMDEEMNVFMGNKILGLVKFPQRNKAIGCKLLYKVKCRFDGKLDR